MYYSPQPGAFVPGCISIHAMTKKTQQNILALIKNECPYCRKHICEMTGDECPVIRSAGEMIRDDSVGCYVFSERILPPDWELNDLTTYANWYGKPKRR